MGEGCGLVAGLLLAFGGVNPADEGGDTRGQVGAALVDAYVIGREGGGGVKGLPSGEGVVLRDEFLGLGEVDFDA